MLSKQALQEFMEIYQKMYGTDLRENEAANMAQELLNFYKVVYADKIEAKNHTKYPRAEKRWHEL